MLPSSPIFDYDTIKRSEQEAATGAPAPDEALLTLVAHLVKQPKPFDIFGRLVAFADTALQYGSPMQLPVVMSHRFYCVLLIHTGNHSALDNPESMFPLSNGQGIVDVALRQLQQLSPGPFGDVPLGFNYRNWKYRFQAFYKRLAHDSHESGISGGFSTPLNQLGQWNRALIESLVALVTQGNQIIRSVPANLATFPMVDMQLDTITMDTTAQAGIAISPQHILADIVLAQHLALLVILSFGNRFPVGNGLQKLEVELRGLNNYLADG